MLLGGSRARGTHLDSSDVDLGLYYRPPLDVDALGTLARGLSGPDAAVTRPGGWGPWGTAVAGSPIRPVRSAARVTRRAPTRPRCANVWFAPR